MVTDLSEYHYEQAREEQWADCDFCNNQGEIGGGIDDDTDLES